ncbi:Uncharacterized membrane protein [Pelagirhabdus alkalitolerans]|uniref:Uncharacterized membrane protein n=1 Tax=Pelagirhabdus alkalitolerans TaxID=1612202 RepID=A0A1G6INQ7_9BACI|nr:DUF5808 domain-containing protein [Pelagirhabdus alkalitolerans]SDC08129.1 Uncharacterized membrane protein [Pelagirhabdus alkalitolerans]
MFPIIFSLILLTIYIPLILLGIFMPAFTKDTLLFGVVIPEDQSKSDKVRKIRRDYTTNCSLSVLIISIMVSGIALRYQNIDMLLVGLIILLITFTINYLYVHHKAKKLKRSERWTDYKKQVVVVNTSHSFDKGMGLTYYWLIPVFVLLITFITTMIHYSDLPQQIPYRFNILGDPLNYRDTGFWSVYLIPITQGVMTGIFYGIYVMLKRAKTSIQASRPEKSIKQNKIAKHYWAKYTLITNSILNLYLMYIQLMILAIISPTVTANAFFHILGVSVPVLGAVIIAMKTGQSGSRIKVEENEEMNAHVIDKDDDRYWKWGLIYYNRQDPTLFIEKRFGVGWTLNFGHPLGLIALLATVIIVIISFVFFM